MQYTLRNVPPKLDEALRHRARMEHKSLNRVAIEALMRACSLAGQPLRQRDLSDVIGRWEEDSETETALKDQRRIDPELWR
ncbi:MAG: hypothetical protein U9Q71_07035 [Pseudomonadota bacterium]|nr:hypothetical protein [Pseudomonadota bacterium]